MSIRTIIEINHDYGDAIDRDPEGFVHAIRSQIRSAYEPETIQRLRHFGVVVVESVHHSTDRKVVIMGKEFPL